MKRIRCLCRARRARSRGVVCSSGAVVVVVGVDLLVGSVSLEWVGMHLCLILLYIVPTRLLYIWTVLIQDRMLFIYICLVARPT